MPGSWKPEWLPNLTAENCEVKSPFDKRYNCIAFAAGDHHNWWWPADDDFWPAGVERKVTLENFVGAFQTKGYEKCDNGDLEEGHEKIALFAKNAGLGLYIPTHAARQLADGKWASKLGKHEDVEHSPVESVNSPSYGEPFMYLKRPREKV